MSDSLLPERLRLSIELALTAGCDDPLLLQSQEAAAGRLGMLRAEVDAARRGVSFDVRTARMLALALARDDLERAERRSRALEAGIDERSCAEIERLGSGPATR